MNDELMHQEKVEEFNAELVAMAPRPAQEWRVVASRGATAFVLSLHATRDAAIARFDAFVSAIKPGVRVEMFEPGGVRASRSVELPPVPAPRVRPVLRLVRDNDVIEYTAEEISRQLRRSQRAIA